MSSLKFDLWKGDCLELMKDIPNGSVDTVLCDLPYGTTQCSWDNIISFDLMWKELNRVVKENMASYWDNFKNHYCATYLKG